MASGRTVFVAVGPPPNGSPFAVYTSRKEAVRSAADDSRIFQVPLWGRVSEIRRERARVIRSSGYESEIRRE